MNFFLKNRLTFWTLIVLIVINVSALVSFLLYTGNKPADAACCSKEESDGRGFSSELGLTAGQSEEVARINRVYRQNAGPVSADIKKKREIILTELESDNPDTVILNQVTKELSTLQMEIHQQNIKQYLELKKVCNPEQAMRLSALYRDLYGCPMQSNKMQNRRQHRHGQN
jgi:Spy/CpxP family protein refolding chaperone